MHELTVGALFAGYDGIGLGLENVLPTRTAWFSEFDAAPSKILAHHWPDVPNHGDMTSINWADVEPVDIITGGFPCQDLSLAGKRAGMAEGTRSGLWSHMAAAIETIRPRLVIAENVRGLLSGKAHSDIESCEGCVDGGAGGHRRALGTVLADLAGLGYDARWLGLRASDVGAPHQRFRVFVVAHPAGTAVEPGGRGAGAGTAGGWTGLNTRPAENADRAARGERWVAAPGQAESGRAWADAGRRSGTPTANTGGERLEGRGTPGVGSEPDPGSGTAVGAAEPAADWGIYAGAIDRWAPIVGRPAPSPTETSTRGGQRLAPTFVEWMMGLPAGHVTDPAIGLTRAEQLKALGNGVVPQQAETAIRELLT